MHSEWELNLAPFLRMVSLYSLNAVPFYIQICLYLIPQRRSHRRTMQRTRLWIHRIYFKDCFLWLLYNITFVFGTELCLIESFAAHRLHLLPPPIISLSLPLFRCLHTLFSNHILRLAHSSCQRPMSVFAVLCAWLPTVGMLSLCHFSRCRFPFVSSYFGASLPRHFLPMNLAKCKALLSETICLYVWCNYTLEKCFRIRKSDLSAGSYSIRIGIDCNDIMPSHWACFPIDTLMADSHWIAPRAHVEQTWKWMAKRKHHKMRHVFIICIGACIRSMRTPQVFQIHFDCGVRKQVSFEIGLNCRIGKGTDISIDSIDSLFKTRLYCSIYSGRKNRPLGPLFRLWTWPGPCRSFWTIVFDSKRKSSAFLIDIDSKH